MVRTKGDSVATKVAGEKAPRKQLGAGASTSTNPATSASDSKKKTVSIGLPYCPQPTPEWQKSVKSFFTFAPKKSDGEQVPEEDKENCNKEHDEVVSKKTKGKGLANGKNAIKKSSKKVKEMECDDAEEKEEKSSDKEESYSEKETTEISSPVKKKKSRVIESDEDD